MQKRAAHRPLLLGGVAFERASVGSAELDAGANPVGGRLTISVRVLCGARPGPRLALIAGLRGDEAAAIEAGGEAAGRGAIVYDVGMARQLERAAVDGAVEAILRLLREHAMLRGLAARRPRPTVARAIERVRAQTGGLVELRAQPGHFALAAEPL